MKYINKVVVSGIALALATASCADLDTKYEGGYVSADQKRVTLQNKAELASASVTGSFNAFYKALTHWTGHLDFGYSATMIGYDIQTEDYISKNSGYNWFASFESYAGGNDGSYPSAMLWFYQYEQIKVCNDILTTITADAVENNNELKFYRAQALALRSFDYWTLAQVYAFNYDGYADAPCVPILTEENANEVALNGCARSTVAETYAQIMKDIDEAIQLLDNNPIKPSDVIDTQSKRLVSKAVAYGLRARYNLSMHKYAEAAQDAQSAIAAFEGRPYSVEEVSVPGFTTMADPSWMWGIAISETQYGIAGGSLVNFPSMTCSFVHGYVDQGGVWKWCSKKLYDKIPSSDVRKGWWLDENRKSRNLSAAQQAYLDQFNIGAPNYGQDATLNLMPYTNVKFGPYQGVLKTALNASDIPLMRIEEMYLTLAEAQAMSGNLAGGKQTLESFIQTYRDPQYTCKATTAEAFQDECWFQRRVELWGEGLAYFDTMRLHKDIDRVGCTFPSAFVYQIKYGDPARLTLIPNDETSANKKISPWSGGAVTPNTNNATFSMPDPVPDQY